MELCDAINKAIVEFGTDILIDGKRLINVLNDLQSFESKGLRRVAATFLELGYGYKLHTYYNLSESERDLKIHSIISELKNEGLQEELIVSVVSQFDKAFALSLGKVEKPVHMLIENHQDQNFICTVNNVSFKMIHVKGGTFQMGLNLEKRKGTIWKVPEHTVQLSDYYIAETQVTQALWKAVMNDNPSHFVGDELPVECIRWSDCQNFISRLNQLTGYDFSLPTEAEWEFAARGGLKSKGYRYSGSDNLDDVAWYCNNSGDEIITWACDKNVEVENNNRTHPVKTKLSNELGIYDMSGNVYEWCVDWYEDYSDSFQINPSGPRRGLVHVIRGGCWKDDIRACQSVDRVGGDRPCSSVGLRLVKRDIEINYLNTFIVGRKG